MNKARSFIGAIWLAFGWLVFAHPPTAGGEQQEPQEESATVAYEMGADARTDRILREAGEYLSGLGEFTFQAQILYDVVTPNGQKLSFGGTVTASVRRPNGLHVQFDGDERTSTILFDGERFTFYDRAENVYARAQIPGVLDAAIDSVFDRFGFSVPIADLVYANPYLTLSENIQDGFYVGRHRVEGTACHHLAFSQETIDWQIWIEDGPRPLPRKLLITYKSEDGTPQYQATMTSWDLDPRFSDRYFAFQPPAGADEIEFLPTTAYEEEKPQ